MKFACRSGAFFAAAAATLILSGRATAPVSYAAGASVFAQDDTMTKEPENSSDFPRAKTIGLLMK